MKKISLTDKDLDSIDPATLVLAQSLGSDDLLTLDGNEVIEMFKEHLQEIQSEETPTLSKALIWNLQDTSGNAFDVILVKEGLPYDASIVEIFPET